VGREAQSLRLWRAAPRHVAAHAHLRHMLGALARDGPATRGVGAIAPEPAAMKSPTRPSEYVRVSLPTPATPGDLVPGGPSGRPAAVQTLVDQYTADGWTLVTAR